MYMDDDGRRPSLTPQLALRVAVVGGIALVAFGVVFFRLWYLQVLSGDKYRAEANDNRVREIKVQAPRGEIVDRNGKVLVNNRTGLAVRVTPKTLSEDSGERRDVYRRLGRVLNLSPPRIERRVDRQLKALPYSPATIKQDVPQKTVYFLFENQEDFPGRHRRAGVPARVPAPAGRRAAVRLRPRGHQGAAGRQAALPGRGPRRPCRPVRHRVPVRPLPARPQRRQPGPGGRAGQPARPAAQPPARAGPPAAAVAGPRRPAGRPERPRGRARRVRGHERPGRPGAGAGQLAELRPQPVLQGAAPVGVQAADLQGGRRAADQPRHLGGVSHRLHLQAHHRHRGARGRADHARHRAQRRRLAEDRPAGVQERRRRGPRARWRCARPCPCPATCTSTSWARRPTARATGC